MGTEVANFLRHILDAYDNGSPRERKRIRVIMVIGSTGSGKSTFIKNLTNDPNIVIGNDLHSQTMQPTLSRVNFPASNNQSYDLFIIDTPGFEDARRSNTNVLKNIVIYLCAMQTRQIMLSGIIYLHRITDDRVVGTSMRSLRMLQNLIGTHRMANVLLVSTRWEERPLTEPDAWQARMERRQQQIEQGFVDRSGNPQQGFWQIYIENGAQVMRHDGSMCSITRIVDRILLYSPPIYTHIQDEVAADSGLPQTATGQLIIAVLDKNAQRLEGRLINLRDGEMTLVQRVLGNVLSERTQLYELSNEKLMALVLGVAVGTVLVVSTVLAVGVETAIASAGAGVSAFRFVMDVFKPLLQ